MRFDPTLPNTAKYYWPVTDRINGALLHNDLSHRESLRIRPLIIFLFTIYEYMGNDPYFHVIVIVYRDF